MNDRHTTLPRLLTSSLDRALSSSPVVVLTGARQTGKTTLARGVESAESRTYLTLDDVETLERARSEPAALLAGPKRITLDEVQRAPDLLLAVKRAVDDRRTAGRFLLTGSANLLLMKRVSESLAGRAVYLELLPLTRRERLGLGRSGVWEQLLATDEAEWPDLLAAESSPEEDWHACARRGGYPTPAHELRTEEDRKTWFAGYVQTYLERDLRDHAEVASLVDFRRLMRAVGLRLGNLVNQTELGRDVGLSQPTVHRHLSLLETTCQLVRLEPYSVNRTKRLIKAPKMYWTDTGLAMHLAGESDPRGAHLENMILCDLLAWRGSRLDAPEVLYWRTTTGDEVDFVVEWKQDLLPIEVKATKRPRLQDAKSLRVFREEYPKRARAGLLLHAGREISWLADGILAAPWWRII